METKTSKPMPLHKILLWLLAAVAIMGGSFFGAAGTFAWPEAWILIVIYIGFATFALSWLRKHNPELLKKRLDVRYRTGKGWDKVIVISLLPVFLLMMVVPGLDVIRFQWSHLPVWIEIAAFIADTLSLILFFRVLQVNTWLSRIVEVRSEQKVVSTGPYAVIRHPLYAGVIIMYISWPLALGSLYGLIPAVLCAAGIAIRAVMEEKTLRRELPGYAEYMKKVRYRLIPGIW